MKKLSFATFIALLLTCHVFAQQQTQEQELPPQQQDVPLELEQLQQSSNAPEFMQITQQQTSFKGGPVPTPTVSERDLLTSSFQLETSDGSQKFAIHVALPYQHKEGHKYPVLYLLDADFLFGIGSETAWILNMGGQVPPMIVVGIGYGTDWTEVSNLRYAYFSPTPSPEFPEKTGKADVLLSFLENILFPHVEAEYGATQQRTFWGSSMGGLFSTYVIATKPTLFQHYIISSPSLWWPDLKSEGSIFKLQKAYNQKHQILPISIFAAVGENEGEADMKAPFRRWIDMLEKHEYEGLRLRHEVIANGSHFSTIPLAYTKGMVWLNRKQEGAAAPTEARNEE